MALATSPSHSPNNLYSEPICVGEKREDMVTADADKARQKVVSETNAPAGQALLDRNGLVSHPEDFIDL